ncbi:hypothetical protein CHS0354_026717 [Potamilus streckersoni]|uniref:Uncharacterized protein n=1 Tax=Potamilus streckersoni TaxID=2493646 RepID=A0AAE0VS16_9BIVA|nr:hypothetical protein CHS0354_026717 [Potamilus streckersoni]
MILIRLAIANLSQRAENQSSSEYGHHAIIWTMTGTAKELLQVHTNRLADVLTFKVYGKTDWKQIRKSSNIYIPNKEHRSKEVSATKTIQVRILKNDVRKDWKHTSLKEFEKPYHFQTV